MKVYKCSNCQSPLYFENNVCLNCQHNIGFDSDRLMLITLESNHSGDWYDISNTEKAYRYCENNSYGTCNWLIPVNHHSCFCIACSLNRTIPSLSDQGNLYKWKNIEVAKHRLIYSLLKLHLAVQPKENEEDKKGIAFDFVASKYEGEKVITGHENGVITLNIEEADETARTRNKLNLGERYRTLLGHFRHETGHYYWDLLIKTSRLTERFREVFGDERKDYTEALEKYYHTPFPYNWANSFISVYATSHPWEDWAETWAHYLHMMDTLETAYSFGVRINPEKVNDQQYMQAHIKKDPYKISDFDEIIKMWLPLTYAVNSLNRSMGHADFYPFVIMPAVVEKLRFIHEVCRMASIGILVPEYQTRYQ